MLGWYLYIHAYLLPSMRESATLSAPFFTCYTTPMLWMSM